jgi:hypothetical protein
MKLLFVPLDITIPNDITFKVGNEDFNRQPFWSTKNIISNNNDYSEYSWLFDQLPFTKIVSFFYKIQQRKVTAHIDHVVSTDTKEQLDLIKASEPAGYHIVLNGKADSLEIFDGKKWVNPILPDAPIAYILNLTSCLHRVKEDYKRTTLYIEGEIDIEKHQMLINRSLEKYSNYAVYYEQ